jgi:hypothetical protein
LPGWIEDAVVLVVALDLIDEVSLGLGLSTTMGISDGKGASEGDEITIFGDDANPMASPLTPMVCKVCESVPILKKRWYILEQSKTFDS